MTAFSVQTPYPPFADADGAPLENGYIWLGSAGLDPQSNPVTAYFDAALTIAAAQPIRTQGGYPVYQGTPARLYINGTNYSIRVMNKNGLTVYTALNTTEAWSGSVLADGSVTSAKLADGSVTTAKIADSAVTAAKVERVAANQVLRSTGVSTDPAWGALDLTTDVTGTLPVANGGTGAATLAANSVLLGNGTSAVQEVAPGASGNLLTSDGTTWTSSSLVVGLNGAVLTSSDPGWTIPAGVTKLKVTVVGGGGGGGTATASAGNTVAGGAGGGGCTAIKWLSGLTPGQTLNVTIGGGGTPGTAGSQSSVASGTATITTISANGGGAGTTISSGTNIAGASGSGSSTSAGADITYGGNDGLAFAESSGANAFSIGGSSAFGGGASKQSSGAGVNGKSYGGGASGGVVISGSSTATGGTGASGVVIFEW